MTEKIIPGLKIREISESDSSIVRPEREFVVVEGYQYLSSDYVTVQYEDGSREPRCVDDIERCIERGTMKVVCMLVMTDEASQLFDIKHQLYIAMAESQRAKSAILHMQSKIESLSCFIDSYGKSVLKEKVELKLD